MNFPRAHKFKPIDHGAVAIPQDDEDELSLVADEVNPPLQGDGLSGVRCTEGAAGVRAP